MKAKGPRETAQTNMRAARELQFRLRQSRGHSRPSSTALRSGPRWFGGRDRHWQSRIVKNCCMGKAPNCPRHLYSSWEKQTDQHPPRRKFGSSLISLSQKHTCRSRRRNGGESSEARQTPDVHRSSGVACEEQQTVWRNKHAGHSGISILHLHEEESEVKRGCKRGRMQCGIVNGTLQHRLQHRLQKPSSLACASTRHCTRAHHKTCHVPK